MKFKRKLITSACQVLVLTSFSSAVFSQTQSIIYDSAARPIQTIESGNNGSVTTQIEYDNNRPGSSRVKRYSKAGVMVEEYDYLNPFNSIITRKGSTRSAENYLTNGFEQFLGKSSNEAGSILATLNADGAVQKVTDARGFEINFTYTPNLSISSIASTDYSVGYSYGAQGAPGAGKIISAQKGGAYGSVATSLTYNKTGYITSKSQTVSSLEEPGTAVLGVAYSYSAGKLVSVTYPSGAVISYQYNGDAVSKVLLNGTTLLDNVVFTAGVNYGGVNQGAFTSWDGVYASGTAAGAPSVPYRVGVDSKANISSYSFGGLSGAQWGNRALVWNTDKMKSRLASRLSPANGLNNLNVEESFSYDAWDHVVANNYSEYQGTSLIKATSGSYAFNTNNGLTSQSRMVAGQSSGAMVSSIASNSDRPQSARIWNAQKEVFEDQNYSYDAAGNLTSISASSNAGSYVLSLNWNSQGQLVSVSNNNPALSLYGNAGITSGIANTSYYYDGFGNRVKKVTKDANGSLMLSTGFLYSDLDRTKILVEYTLNYEANRIPSNYGNFSSKEYIYLPNPTTGVLTPAAMLRQSTAGLEVFYLMPDQLGSVQSVVQARASIDTAGQPLNNTAYLAYSGVLGGSKTYYREDFSKNGGFNLRAPGQYLDIETGLLYNNARYFNPWTGTFISADPIGKDGGTNVYAYGVGSLINDVDDSGLIIPVLVYEIGQIVIPPIILATIILHKNQNTNVNSSTSVASQKSQCPPILLIKVPASLYPETAAHIRDAINSGHPYIVTLDRWNKAVVDARRSQATKGFPTDSVFDNDEYPMAMFKEGGAGASVRKVSRSDNRGAGSYIRHQCAKIPDGCQVQFVP